jgi:hypothetical protein
MAEKSETRAFTVEVFNEVLHGISQRLAGLEGQLTPNSLREQTPTLVQNYYLTAAPAFRGGPEVALAHSTGLDHCRAIVIHRQHRDDATDQKTINIETPNLDGTARVQVWAGSPGQEGSGPPSGASTREWNKDQVKESRSLPIDPGENLYMHYDKGDQTRTSRISIKYEVT